jgi:hypothetical protein
MPDIARAEDARGQPDERVERDEDGVEIVGDQQRRRARPGMDQQERAEEGDAARQDVEPRGQTVVAEARRWG